MELEPLRSKRSLRTRRNNNRGLIEDGSDRPRRPVVVKRLFTPEIKKLLKDWLVRRRDNPYPNREEKKMLALQTGLTYVQVCNWFANWRRKLKNNYSCEEEEDDDEDDEEEEEEDEEELLGGEGGAGGGAPDSQLLTKWLESAANFRPSRASYLGWGLGRSARSVHGRAEIAAAEALTTLANARANQGTI